MPLTGARWTGEEIMLPALFGIGIGVTEELATRGMAVTTLRDAGHGERRVHRPGAYWP